MNKKSSKTDFSKTTQKIKDLFDLPEADRIEVDAKVLSAKFLSEIQIIADERNIKGSATLDSYSTFIINMNVNIKKSDKKIMITFCRCRVSFFTR